ncbi:epoxyqueuosine reductase [Candidatus Poribacteria bacterium]|nr:MAG: epoxyqueuosine reductase [Candidatus Poribacteria bacterium]
MTGNPAQITLTQQIQRRAHELGFALVGITPAERSQTLQRYRAWLGNGYAGEMDYLERHLPLKEDPRRLLAEAKSVISLAMNYYTLDPPELLAADPGRGQISRYAWGDDYHEVIRERLRQLVEFIRQRFAETEPDCRICVDTAPILEREYAQKARLGWIGKNTNLINWRSGSWYFLAEVLVNVRLESTAEPQWPVGGGSFPSSGDSRRVTFAGDRPPRYETMPFSSTVARGSCGTCTRCIEACPTDAIVAPNVLDSRLCISYLTIELKDSIPAELRPKMGNLIFGCDICQEVCPWNSKATPTTESAFYPREGNLAPALLSLVNMTQAEFSSRFKGSPIKRAKRRGFLRNVLVAIGNWGARKALPALEIALSDGEPLVRSHAAWAVGQIGGETAAKLLQTRLVVEEEPEVIAEIQGALARL